MKKQQNYLTESSGNIFADLGFPPDQAKKMHDAALQFIKQPDLAKKEALQKAWVEESLQRFAAYQRGEMESYSLEEFAAKLEN